MLTFNADGAQQALVRSNGDALTYDALRAAVGRGAAQLTEAGAGPGVVVAVAVADPLRFLICALATWQCEAALLPVDTRAGAKWQEQVCARAGAQLLVRTAEPDGTLRAEALRHARTVDPRVGLVLFTSGSTGGPKGVLLSREGVAANVQAILEYLPVRACPRTAVVLPLSYSYALVGQALTTLHAGGTLLLLGDLGYPALQLGAMRRLGASGLSSVPLSLRDLSRLAADAEEGAPGLGYIASAGAALDAATARAVRAAFPAARLFNQYGLTEASPRVAAIDAADPAFERGSVGRALRGLEVFAVDAEGNRLPPGGQGELAVRGPSVMLGYLDDEEATARVLCADGTLRTGDGGWVDEDGYVFVSGRQDGVVKCAGERVSVEEVAQVLRQGASKDAIEVVAIADEVLGARLVAFAEGDDRLLDTLRRTARELLPPAKRPVRFHALSALPRTHNGKVDQRALRELAISG